jgi:hypothetical protein
LYNASSIAAREEKMLGDRMQKARKHCFLRSEYYEAEVVG